VHHAGGLTVLTGPRARRALELKSAAFDVAAAKDGAVLVVTGRGWGHGVGLCQWGARGSAEHGMDEDAILRKYYPGSVISKLW
jgi:stage II sporulation protein D